MPQPAERIVRQVRLTLRVAHALALALALTLPAGAGAQAALPTPIASLDTAWSALSRTYWDTTFVQGPWRAAYDSIRATVRATDDDDTVRGAIRALIRLPGQSHFVLIPGSAVPTPASGRGSAEREGAGDDPDRPGTLGLMVRSIADTVVAWRVAADGPAARAGLRAGDVITMLDTLPVDSLRARIARSAGADRDEVNRLVTTFVLSRLGGDVGDSTRVGYRDARGAARSAWLVRTPLAGNLTQMGNLPPMVVSATLDSVSVGSGRFATVLGFSAWFPAISPELDRYLFSSRHSAGLIIDLRGNPGGVIGMVAGVSGHMLDTAIALGVLRGRGATLRFVANPRRVDRTGTRVDPFAGPIAILVDAFTASTSEFFAAGMQGIGRARIFGERSAGMSLPALMSRLPNGDVLMHAIADHEDAVGRRVEGVGVMPDELVLLRRVDLGMGRDAALDAARAWIAKQQP